jgi:hypothetical protein
MSKRTRHSPKGHTPKSPNSISSIRSNDGSPSISLNSPLSPTSSSFLDLQPDMAKRIKDLYMQVNKVKADGLFFYLIFHNKDLLNKFDLEEHNFYKELMFPATLINIMTRLGNLEMVSLASKKYKEKHYQADMYRSYGMENIGHYMLSITDTLSMKVLYLICYQGIYYLSPLNIRDFRDSIRKDYIEFGDIDAEYLETCNQDMKTIFQVKKQNGKLIVHIDAASFDMVSVSGAFIEFTKCKNNITVIIDTPMHHKSSILDSNIVEEDECGHLISVSKCYNYTMVNTTWRPFNIFHIEDFQPGVEQYYHIDTDHKYLEKISKKDIDQSDVYHSHYDVHKLMDVSLYGNVHFFTGKYLQRSSRGGSQYSHMIPEVSVCADIYFPANNHGFCWFSAIVNSWFFADDISTIFLNKAISGMDKTLAYIKDFYETGYETFDQDRTRDLKKFVIHLIRLFTFIYCSFSMLSKNQIGRVRNKKKWLEIYNHITDDYYEYIYVFITALSKVMDVA